MKIVARIVNGRAHIASRPRRRLESRANPSRASRELRRAVRPHTSTLDAMRAVLSRATHPLRRRVSFASRRGRDVARVATRRASPESPPPVPDTRDFSLLADADDPHPRAADGRVALKGMRRNELADWLESVGEKRSRADSLFRVMYRETSTNADVDESEAFGAKFKARLLEKATMDGDLKIRDTRVATDGTRKVTYELVGEGGGTVESVLIPALRENGRTTVCVSSQLGCAMNCQFCYTAKMGLRKNLTAAQIVEQVVHARRMVGANEVSNVVFMGMGEPLHNVSEVLRACDILLDDKGLAFSRNKVTVSTSGLVPQMERFLRESEASLAVSLNATTDYIRNWIMPINRKYNLETLLGLLRREFPRAKLGRHQRQVFFEYIMLEGVNDSDEDADRLVDIARDVPCKINLIYFNTHDGSEFKCSDQERIKTFRQRISDAGVTCTIRQSRGDEEASACGQLGNPGDNALWKPEPPRMRDPRTRAQRL
jgi:23S rRNA (adenine2503-C2)-methyltransferase